MPFLNNITATVNQLIIQAFSGIPPANIKAYGISEVMIEPGKNDEGKEITFRYPSVIDADGEVTKIDVDDAFSMMFYHKIEGITNSIDVKTGFGNGRGNLTEAANISLMLYAFRRKTRKEAWWFEAVIKDTLPEELKISDREGTLLQRSLVRIGNSSYDKLGLLQREYTEIQLNYPDLIVMELKYRIESSWKKGCFLTCGCESVLSEN